MGGTVINIPEIDNAYLEGARIGIEKGEEQLIQLIENLISTNRRNEVDKALADRQYRLQLYKEFNIE